MDIYKLTTQGETRYEMMTGERAQMKNHKRGESKLSNRWLPVELEDVPNDAEIRNVSGKMVNAGELKGDEWAGLNPIDGTQVGSNSLPTVIRAPDPTPTPQPIVNPVPVDGEALAKAEASQPPPDAQTPASVAPVAAADVPMGMGPPDAPEGGLGGRNPAASPMPDWYKGDSATMEDEQLRELHEDHQTDPRKPKEIPDKEWDYQSEVMRELQERQRMEWQQKEAAEDAANRQQYREAVKRIEDSPADMPNGSGKPSRAIDEDEMINRAVSEDNASGGTAGDETEPLRIYQLVGTTRVVQMTASEAALLNKTSDREWLEAPDYTEFAKPRKAGRPAKGNKWRGLSGSSLLLLAGSEGLTATVARELVKRLTGFEPTYNTVATRLSQGRNASDSDLPKIGRDAWAEFWHEVGQAKKALGENGNHTKPVDGPNVAVGPLDDGDELPVDRAAIEAVADTMLHGRAEKSRQIISAYRLKFHTLLDDMQDELLKALTD